MSISLQFAIFYFLHGNVTRISYFFKVFITSLQFYNLLFSTWVYHYNLLFSTFCMGMSLEFPIFWKCLSQFSYFLDVYCVCPWSSHTSSEPPDLLRNWHGWHNTRHLLQRYSWQVIFIVPLFMLLYTVTGMGGITPGPYYNNILDR